MAQVTKWMNLYLLEFSDGEGATVRANNIAYAIFRACLEFDRKVDEVVKVSLVNIKDIVKTS